jgi:hypothetical protein
VNAAVGEPLGPEPKPLALVGQEFKRRPRAVAKAIDRAIQRMVAQRLATPGRQPLEAFPPIDRLPDEKAAAVGGEWPPHAAPRNACRNGASGGAAAWECLRSSRPAGRVASPSTPLGPPGQVGGAVTATKPRAVGGA